VASSRCRGSTGTRLRRAPGTTSRRLMPAGPLNRRCSEPGGCRGGDRLLPVGRTSLPRPERCASGPAPDGAGLRAGRVDHPRRPSRGTRRREATEDDRDSAHIGRCVTGSRSPGAMTPGDPLTCANVGGSCRRSSAPSGIPRPGDGMILKRQRVRRSAPGHGPGLPGSFVLAALLVAMVASRVSAAHRVSDVVGALYSAAAAWTITAEGAATFRLVSTADQVDA
jgi:hypothetical protein